MERKEDTGCGVLWKRVKRKNDRLVLEGICGVKLPKGTGRPDLSKFQICIRRGDDDPGKTKFHWVKGLPFLKGYRLRRFSWEIPLTDAVDMDIQNKLDLYYGDLWLGDFNYDILSRRVGDYRNTRPVRWMGQALYFRQTIHNKIWFVVRPENIYDRPWHRFRVFCAWALSKVLGDADYVLMFEKESSRYEESASVLYEELVDSGYTNVRYILNKDNLQIPRMKPQYRRYLVAKDSFKHLLCFFRAKKFVGTENIDHAMQLRAANRHLMTKMQSTDLTQVFLQHGVMYMVSLDAENRVFFQNHDLNMYRAVVSSEAEAMHFVLLGGFSRQDMYVTGLAKFDRSIRRDNAELIMIMPTWRRWEVNLAQKDFESTGYYQMLQRIVNGIPEHLRDRIVVKPHPLMEKMMQSHETELTKYLRPELSHNDTLERTRLLITDYSSIAYDAFYRGSNVVFYWEDKEECMRNYGNAHLMINEHNIFGDICYSEDQLTRAVEKNYDQEQQPLYRRRYERIVAFHDNRNTQRIIEKLKEDGII